MENLKFKAFFDLLYPFLECIFWGIQSLKGASSFVTFGWMMICDKKTENHNFTITTNTSQHVEFFHSLIFSRFPWNLK